MTMTDSVRTRFAPSPTGRLHLGNIRAAVFNWLFSRHHGGAFVLRLEDTDVGRNVAGAEAGVLEDLRWLGLTWDEGPEVGGPHAPYRQSERGATYRAAVDRLVEAGAAYPCFCDGGAGEEGGDDEDAEGGEEPGAGWRRYDGRCRALDAAEARARVDAGEAHVVRFAAPRDGVVVVHDVVRGAIETPAADVDDFVLVRGDGRPTYNFAVVVDDVDMAISHVIRGSGHLSNTPKQALLFDALGVPRPVFAHLAQVLDPAGGKLSKRTGARPLSAYRADGFLPDALVNYLSLLGWSDPREREVLTRDELVEAISLERLGASDTAYDPEKLRWVATRHMAALPLEAVVEGVRPYLQEAGPPFDAWSGAELESAVEALRSRLGAFGEVRDHLHFFEPPAERMAEARRTVSRDPEARTVIDALMDALAAVSHDAWSPEAVKAAVTEAGAAAGVRGKALYTPLRLAVSGEEHGPDVARILHTLGRTRTLERLAAVSTPAPN